MCLVVLSAFASCAKNKKEEQTTSAVFTTTTTTEPTTVTTTENEKTTFAEVYTAKVYKGLSKDKYGEYPYKIASYSTYYNAGDTMRTQNLETAVSKVNNIVIPSGEVFSFNQTVGKRTVTAGYETAKIVRDGEFVDGLGGGVCQVSSTIFECALRTNAEIIERYSHSLTVVYVPLGGDATVMWPSADFKFRNRSSADFRIKMHCDSGTLTCSIYANKDVNVGDIKINIKKSGKNYILTRKVNGVQNYITYSQYQEPKTTTTKKAKTTEKDEKSKKSKKEKTTKKSKKSKKTTTKKSKKSTKKSKKKKSKKNKKKNS